MKLLTPAECSERARVSLSLIYSVLKCGRLPALRIGARGRGKWLVEEASFEAWLASCRTEESTAADGPLAHIR